jgi:excisionase family DNA binding protein
MQVITIESEAFKKLTDSIEEIKTKLSENQKNTPLSETWLDNQEVCKLLYISPRTLQSYRDNGKIPFSQQGSKIYYKASDIDEFLENSYNKAFATRKKK